MLRYRRRKLHFGYQHQSASVFPKLVSSWFIPPQLALDPNRISPAVIDTGTSPSRAARMTHCGLGERRGESRREPLQRSSAGQLCKLPSSRLFPTSPALRGLGRANWTGLQRTPTSCLLNDATSRVLVLLPFAASSVASIFLARNSRRPGIIPLLWCRNCWLRHRWERKKPGISRPGNGSRRGSRALLYLVDRQGSSS